MVYYEAGTETYQYNLNDNTISSNSDAASRSSEVATLSSTNYPIPITKEVHQKGSDGYVYYFFVEDSEEAMQSVYRYNPYYSNSWQFITYRLFDNQDFQIIMGNT